MAPQAWDFPDVFVQTPVRRWEAVAVATGTAYSSHAPASWFFHPVLLDYPVAVSNINVFKSINASVPGATSQASSGSIGYSYSHGVTLFTRQDYSNNSSNLSAIKTASGGISVSLSYTSTAQTFGMSWVTNTTGGVSNFTTTSSDGNWSSFATGPKRFVIPLVTTLSAGEYFWAHAHSSTTATSNSNVTLLSVSNLHAAPQNITYGELGNSVTINSGWQGIGQGAASAVTTNASMAGTVISVAAASLWVQQLSGV